VAPKPPLIFLLEPQDGQRAAIGERIVFTGLATDREDGPVPEEDLQWFSDIDGLLGHGANVDTELSPGAHTITLLAEDADGLVGESTVQVFVGAMHYMPLILK
jgi:hypothetical protein